MTATERGTPFIMFAASGGARMQEGILSLMQMPRTTVAIQRLREARKPYIVVLTNPTTGGVTASYAMLGDVQIAEPGALIGFAGPRVIEQTIREKLPEGFQRSEYLKEHGMVDMVVHRNELKPTLANLCRLLTKAPDRRRRTRGGLIQRRGSAQARCRNDDVRRDHCALHGAASQDGSTCRSAASRACCARLGHPERGLPPVIHVAGTNGKGSTIAFMRAALEAAGHGVHVYTSPHLVHFHERIRLAAPGGGRLVDEARLVAALEHCEAVNAGEPDHRLRDHHRRRLRALRRDAGRRAAARGGARRAHGRDQCHRRAARQRHHLDLARSRRFPRHRHRRHRGREGRHPASAASPAVLHPQIDGCGPRSSASPTGSARP